MLLFEPDPSVRDALTVLLSSKGWTVATASNCGELIAQLPADHVVAVISEASLPDCTPQHVLEQCKAAIRPVIFTGHDLSLQSAVDLIRQGAMDFLDKPFPQVRLLDLLDNIEKRA